MILFLIRILGESFENKDPVANTFGITAKDFITYFDTIWEDHVREDLSLIAVDRITGKVVGVALCTDLNTRRKKVPKKTVSKPMGYLIEILDNIDRAVRYDLIAISQQ